MTKLPFTLPSYMGYKEGLTSLSLSRPEKQIQRNVEYLFALMNLSSILSWSNTPYLAYESYVRHSNKIWRANTNNQNSEPVEGNTDWTLIIDLNSLGGYPIPGYSFTTRTKVPEIVVTSSTSIVDFPSGFTYSVGSNQLEVFVDGLLKNSSEYTETSSTQLTFSQSLFPDSIVQIFINK